MSGFNPDDYLAAPPAPVDPDAVRSISPEAEERAIRAMLAPQVGGGETAINSFVDMLPAGGRLRDILQALADRDIGERARLTPQAREELERLGPIETPGLPAEPLPQTAPEPPSILDNYRLVRDERRERTAAGREQNPTAGRLGTALGIVGSIVAPLPGITVAARGAAAGANAGRGLSGAARLAALARTPTGSRLASATATGAAYGALGGATEGEADLTRGDIRGGLRDAAAGVRSGALWGAAGGAVAENARLAIPWLRRLAVRNTKEAIQGQSDIGAATRKPMRDESAAQVLDDGQLRAFDNVEDIHNRIVPQADAEGEALGRIIRDLEARGFEGPRARVIAQELTRRGESLNNRISSDKSPAKVYTDEAASILAAERANGGTLGVRQTENIKSSIQGRAPFAKRESSERGDALKDASRVVRQAVEDSLFEQAASRDARASQGATAMGVPLSEVGGGRFYGDKVQGFIDQKARTGKYLDAAQFSTRAQSKFDQRPRVGLPDTIAGAAAGGDNILKQKFWAKVNSELRSRSASTTAVGAEALRKSLASGRAAERLGVGASSFGPMAEDEAEKWVQQQDPENPDFSPEVRALLRVLRSGTAKKEQ